MRRLVLALMIVLLPLRGWAGDAMATQMASAATATKTGAANAHEIRTASSFNHKNQAFGAAQAMPDCHEQVASHQQTDQTANNDHCGTCQACQACHTVALLPALLEVMANLSSPQMRPTRIAFTSAAAALGQKPPIA